MAVLAHGAAPGGAVGLLPLVACAVLALLYLAGVRRLRSTGRSWSTGRTASFLTGTALLALALSPALEPATDLRTHAAQHLLLGLYAPLALVLGAPLTVLLSALPVPARRPVGTVLRSRAVHGLSHVGTAAVLSVGGLYVVHLTPLYALSTRSEAVHLAVHAHFLLAGCLFAWAVAGPDPAPRRPGLGTRVAVLVAAGGAHAFLAKLLYSRAPAWPPGSGSSVADVETAAQLLYYGGSLGDLLLLTALGAAWYRRTGRVAARSPLLAPASG